MTTLDQFLTLLREEVGLTVSADDVGLDFDQLPGWDSALLLHLVTVLERTTGKPLSLPDVLGSRSLSALYDLTVAA
ncbi:phosphopantetheine-binding protein [Amycolatopsis pithecellobii]|uniref:Acyl carrier protein n=1 Tax=Amycolatopsis pithecellobii TaxID=664692 RepID=A0A6N7Z9U1_9PSEU|nr:phosphopantetheine-binding protein [Amycolatopsis pithecellobii]MTD58508.1 acyl carrier protein [Amycolatopsis pithecellobii]